MCPRVSVPLGVYDLSMSLLLVPVCVYVHACAWSLCPPLGQQACLLWVRPPCVHTSVCVDGLTMGRRVCVPWHLSLSLSMWMPMGLRVCVPVLFRVILSQ